MYTSVRHVRLHIHDDVTVQNEGKNVQEGQAATVSKWIKRWQQPTPEEERRDIYIVPFSFGYQEEIPSKVSCAPRKPGEVSHQRASLEIAEIGFPTKNDRQTRGLPPTLFDSKH